jgi:hypothetical protein
MAQKQADSGPSYATDLPDDVREIVTIWTQLPSHTRQAILDMVRHATTRKE